MKKRIRITGVGRNNIRGSFIFETYLTPSAADIRRQAESRGMLEIISIEYL